MTDTGDKSVLEDKSLHHHVEQDISIEKHIGDPDYNIDSLGRIGAVREPDEADHVTWKTWIVIVV
jgi:hypothetical protein